MKIHEKIRTLREENQWSQEELAAKLGLSVNGYRKIERGETRLNIPRLQQLATIFHTDILEFIQDSDTTFYQVNHDSDYCVNVSFDSTQTILLENEKLKLINAHQLELLAQKDKELEALKEVIRLMKTERQSAI